jgi:hypothetical protein
MVIHDEDSGYRIDIRGSSAARVTAACRSGATAIGEQAIFT